MIGKPTGSAAKPHIPSTSHIDKNGRIVDKIDEPFVNDPGVIGRWESVDFVKEMQQFDPSNRQWTAGELFLKGLVFLENGKTFQPWWTWTKGKVFHHGDKTAAQYHIVERDGQTYMFFEWKSGDYTIRHQKPYYYVLKKVSSEPGDLIEARRMYSIGDLETNSMTIEIEALIDGRDHLIIQGNTLQWKHFEWAVVGRHEPLNEPTVISTRTTSEAPLERVEWIPEWFDLKGQPLKSYRQPALSSKFQGLTPPLPRKDVEVEITLLRARGDVRVEQQPSAKNDYTLIVEFNDNLAGGASTYKVRLTIKW
jgi:hypothetical protein